MIRSIAWFSGKFFNYFSPTIFTGHFGTTFLISTIISIFCLGVKVEILITLLARLIRSEQLRIVDKKVEITII